MRKWALFLAAGAAYWSFVYVTGIHSLGPLGVLFPASRETPSEATASEPEERMWVVLTFENDARRPMQMSFNNPAVPRMRLSRCREMLPSIAPTLERAAKEAEASLSSARLIGSECISGEEDPIRPAQGGI